MFLFSTHGRAEEQVGRQADDGLEKIGVHDALADLALGATTEQHAVGHHHAHHAAGVGHSEHVQQKRQVAAGPRRNGAVPVEAVVFVAGRVVVAPVLHAERRIGDDAVVGVQPALRIHQAGFGDDVARHQARRSQAVEQHVQLADGQGIQVPFLTFKNQVLTLPTTFLHVIGSQDEHAT